MNFVFVVSYTFHNGAAEFRIFQSFTVIFDSLDVLNFDYLSVQISRLYIFLFQIDNLLEIKGRTQPKSTDTIDANRFVLN